LKELGVTVVIITHRMNILAVVDRMLVLRSGTVYAYGERDEVLSALQQGAHLPSHDSVSKK
jgi:ABC-type protease/lipase transport system fused ATPase/permease subunit